MTSKRFVLATLLVLGTGGAGVGLALLYAKLSGLGQMQAGRMGWDVIADMLGAMMVGGLLGLVCGIALVSRIPKHKLAQTALLTWLLVPVLAFAARALPAKQFPTVPAEPAFEPAFSVAMYTRMAALDAQKVAPERADFRHRSLSVNSANRLLLSKAWGPHTLTPCLVDLDPSELEFFAHAVEQLSTAEPAPCDHIDDTPGYYLSYSFAGAPDRVLFVSVECLAERPAIERFLAEFETVRSRHADITGCGS